MGAQLNALVAEFRAIDERAKALVLRVGEARLMDRPVKGGWSIAECFEHLNMTTRSFLPQWREQIAKAPSGSEPYKTDFKGKLLSWLLEPPARMKMPTTPPFQPMKTPSPDQVLPAFVACQAELIAALESGSGKALDRVKVESPFRKGMQYSVWSSFRIAAAHSRRHLWQAERVIG